jgi:hypothetical protein
MTVSDLWQGAPNASVKSVAIAPLGTVREASAVAGLKAALRDGDPDLFRDGASVCCLDSLDLLPASAPRDRGVSLTEGASSRTAFLRVVLPMRRNVLIAAGLFTVGMVGNDFMLASMFLMDPSKQTVAAGLGVMDVSLEELVTVAGV